LADQFWVIRSGYGLQTLKKLVQAFTQQALRVMAARGFGVKG
jgi:hypothetical protein